MLSADLLEIYHSESKVMRESQQNLRTDATQVKSLTDVKKHLKRKIEDQKQWQQRSSPHSGAQMHAEIEKLEEELVHFKLLTVAPSPYLPRGMIATISLRLLGGPAAHHASHEVCRYPGCLQISSLAALKSEHTPSG